MSERGKLLTLGHISGVHGLKGWVKVFSHTEPREAILDYQPWRLGDQDREVRVTRGQRHGKTVIAVLPGVETPEAARALVGQEIRVPRDALPDNEQGSWYWADLLGLEVSNLDGERLGTVRQMIETGAHDVMVLDGDRERLVPFVPEQIVRDVDLQEGTIRVDWHADD